MTIKLNDAELAALAGLPYLAACLYVLAIRTRMDYGTGMVGDRPRISWQALTEWVYIEPARGIRSGSPSRWAVMRAANHLEKTGLIRLQSSIANAQLRIFLPLADRSPSLVRSKPAQKPQGLAARPVQRENPPKAATPKTPKAAIHPVPVPTNTRAHNNNRIYTLEWADSIGEPDRHAIEKQLAKNQLDEQTAQTVIDELAGAIQLKPVSNKAGYARALIQKAAAGEFTPEKAGMVEQQRIARQRHQDAIERAERAAPAAAPIDKEKGRAFIANIRKSLKGRPTA